MDENKRILNDEELEKVNGGSHLSSDEVKNLHADQKLIMEDDLGVDIAEVTYLNTYDNPGPLSFLRCKVRIDKLYFKDSKGTLKLSFGGEPTVHEGQELYVPRWYLDFPERA